MRPYLIPDLARACEALVARASERGRIGKTPVQSLGHPGKDWAAFGATFVTYCDYVREQLAGFENIEHGLSLILRNIHPDLAHRFDCQRVERAGFQPGAVRFKIIAANLVKKRFGHLAAGAVVDTNE